MKMRRMGLDTLRPGEQCVLRQIRLPAAQRMRLEELGLLPGRSEERRVGKEV